ncbi:MAG: 1-acyl-sn-glycerol-3-phosphate acyltransferase [Acidobacteriota bacterium]
MTHSVSIPAWLLALLVVAATLLVLERLLLPSVRYFLRRRVNRVLDELNTRLRIKVQPFKLTKRQVLIDRLRFDPEVMAAVEQEAKESGTPRAVSSDRVRRYAQEIVPAFNAYLYFRFGYRLGRTVARFLYRVRVGFTDEESFARFDPRSTVVFVMNHRSNMDYVLVAYLAAASTALSYAVGEWARIWPLQTLIRSMGAYFVRRRSKNPLYRRVLERYVAMATASGVTQAVYPEGGLSRDGALRPPKLGLLDYMLRSFDPQGERDLVFVPVGLNYDRVLEDRTLLLDVPLEGMPRAAKPSSARAAWNTLSFVGRNLRQVVTNRWYRFGYACVNFGTPVSMREWLAGRRVDLRSLERRERFEHIGDLAEELMAGVGRVIPVVPVPLVAAVFVAAHEAGDGPLSSLEVKARVLRRMDRLSAAGAHVYVPRRDQDYAVSVGLRMLLLRHLIREQDGLHEAVPEELPVLRYYAHSIAHLEGSESGAGSADAPEAPEAVEDQHRSQSDQQ